MTVFVAHQDASYTEEVNRRGAEQRQFDYFGKSSPLQFGPEAFLVDYGPRRTTSAHFHSVDQFQVFFGAPGARYLRHQIPDVELHYADTFVTYGPFSAGDSRFTFFTLRPCQGQFKGEMPAERHKLRYQGRRGLHVDLDPYLATPAGPGESTVATVIGRHDDGLSAIVVTAGRGAPIALPSTAGTSGAYACVLSGDVDDGRHRAGALGRYSLAWIGTEESPQWTAAADDTRVVIMTFPYPPTPDAVDTARDGCDTRSTLE